MKELGATTAIVAAVLIGSEVLSLVVVCAGLAYGALKLLEAASEKY